MIKKLTFNDIKGFTKRRKHYFIFKNIIWNYVCRCFVFGDNRIEWFVAGKLQSYNLYDVSFVKEPTRPNT